MSGAGAIRVERRTLIVVLSFSLALSCARMPPPPPRPAATYANPFAYCAAVQTIDTPDGRYTGPTVPKAVADGLREAFGAPADAPPDAFVSGTSWRCMNGKVYACNVGANLPCAAKADTNQKPTKAMEDFCAEQRDAEAVPAVVTGRETVYSWRCRDGTPVIERQITHPDGRGFLSNVWYAIRPPGASTAP